MEKNLVKRAYEAFNLGDYKAAKELFKKASKKYGESFFYLNIALCEKNLQDGEGKTPPAVKLFFEDTEVKKMQDKIRDLQRQLREKDANINERFEELAILTRMLEEKDNAVST